MYEEDILPNPRSESAFSGTSYDVTYRPFEDLGSLKTEPTVLLLDDPARTASAVSYGHSVALLVPAGMIPSHQKGDILEVTVARLAEPTIEYRLYTRHTPGYKRAYLDLHQIGASHGETFFIKTVHLYDIERFAIEYNEAKPLWLTNVQLLWEGKLKMGVSGTELEFRGSKLRTYQGQAVLDCTLDRAGRIKIVKGPDGFGLRLGDHSVVQGIQVRGNSVWMAYSRSRHDRQPHLRLVEGPGREEELGPTPVPEITIIRVIRPEIPGQPYIVEVDEETVYRVAKELSALGLEDFREMKGSISEVLVARLLPEMGMEFVEDHPHRPSWWQVRARMPGPDLLAKLVETGSLVYVETKWWSDVEDAKRKAVHQVITDLRRYPTTKKGELVRGAYAALVEWETGQQTFRVHLLEVKTID